MSEQEERSMGITNSESGTRIDEVTDGIFRISTPVGADVLPGGFSFNQYLLVDEQPLLFHTGMRAIFPLVRQAIESVMPLTRLRFVGFAHYEADECGAMAELLSCAPEARPVCGQLQAMLAAEQLSDRKPHVLADGDSLELGKRRVRWIDAPHVPHGWDNGFLFETSEETLFAGDLFTQPGDKNPPITEGDVLGPSEAMRKAMDYYAKAPQTGSVIERLAAMEPRVLLCMHGSAYRGDGGARLRELATALSG
jgi:flavorubredoxin